MSFLPIPAMAVAHYSASGVLFPPWLMHNSASSVLNEAGIGREVDRTSGSTNARTP